MYYAGPNILIQAVPCHVKESHMMSDTAQPSRAWRRLPRPKQVCHFVCAVAVVAGVVVLGQQLHRTAGTKMQVSWGVGTRHFIIMNQF